MISSLSISEVADFHTQQSIEFMQNCLTKHMSIVNTPSSFREIKMNGQIDLNLNGFYGYSITTLYYDFEQKSISECIKHQKTIC